MKNIFEKKGIALILATIFMSLLLFLSIFYLNFSVSENKISKSQISSEKTYYLAESGVNELVWKLKNNSSFKTAFETNPTWSTTTIRNNPFGANSETYSVSIQNTSKAHGEITATGTVTIAGKTSQRVIKAGVYRAIGESVIGSNALFTDKNGGSNNVDLNINNSLVDIKNGGLHSNKRIDILSGSTVYVEGDLEAVNNLKTTGGSTITFSSTTYDSYDMHDTPAPTEIDMPAVDFNTSPTSSLKSKATTIYTSAQFQTLINASSSMTLNGITYITGSGAISIAKNFDLTINGVLVLEGSITINSGTNKINNITIATSSLTNISGIFAISNISLQQIRGTVNIKGVLYSRSNVIIEDISYSGTSFNILGGIVAKGLTIEDCSKKITLTYNNDIVSNSIGGTSFSPILTVEHWEEQY